MIEAEETKQGEKKEKKKERKRERSKEKKKKSKEGRKRVGGWVGGSVGEGGGGKVGEGLAEYRFIDDKGEEGEEDHEEEQEQEAVRRVRSGPDDRGWRGFEDGEEEGEEEGKNEEEGKEKEEGQLGGWCRWRMDTFEGWKEGKEREEQEKREVRKQEIGKEGRGEKQTGDLFQGSPYLFSFSGKFVWVGVIWRVSLIDFLLSYSLSLSFPPKGINLLLMKFVSLVLPPLGLFQPFSFSGSFPFLISPPFPSLGLSLTSLSKRPFLMPFQSLLRRFLPCSLFFFFFFFVVVSLSHSPSWILREVLFMSIQCCLLRGLMNSKRLQTRLFSFLVTRK